MLIKAKQLAEKDDLESLQYWLNYKSAERNEKISAVTAIYDKLKIKEITREKILGLTQKALDSLDKVSVENSKKIELKNLAGKLINRNS